MNILLKIFREIAYAVGVLIIALIVGNILFLALNDLFGDPGKTYYKSTKDGLMLLFGLVVLVIHIIRRIFRRKKSPPQPPS